MESTTSSSKGVFLFSKGLKSKRSKEKHNSALFEILFKKECWYIAYKKNWDCIENRIKELHHSTYSLLHDDIVNYIKSFYGGNESVQLEGVIPTATLCSSVNQPDCASQFVTLIDKVRDEVSPHIAMINSQDAPTVKHLVENVVWQLIYGYEVLDTCDENYSDDATTQTMRKLKKHQCTMAVLKKWYTIKYITASPKKNEQGHLKKSLVIIIPEFESFNCSALQDFVIILSSYIPYLPIVFIFGVATSVSALHKSFPYYVLSKLLIKVFQLHSSLVYMNQVLEEVFLTHTNPFHLSGKAFGLLTDVFLFYDLSVTGLIQNIKYCMMDHYYGDNIKSLCCDRNELYEAIMQLNAEDLENIRRLSSFRKFLEVQQYETKIALFTDDDFFKDILYEEMNRLHEYLYNFYACVRLLSVFVKDLPRIILGETVREIYTKCAAECITNTQGFKDCMQIMNFQPQVKLVESIKNALQVLKQIGSSPLKSLPKSPTKKYSKRNMGLNNNCTEQFIETVRLNLLTFLRQIKNSSTAPSNESTGTNNYSENVSGNRYKLKEKLLKATRVDRIPSQFEMIRSRFVMYLKEIFTEGLQPPHVQPFHEILFFSDVSNVKKHIVPSPRGAVHTALSNPVHYLQCSCCHLHSSESVVNTLPDICLAYKLHQECGKHINLYDWLQAFTAILRPDLEDDQTQQDSDIHMRFKHAVAELQFLGFIKSSKRKTDHVIRLTW